MSAPGFAAPPELAAPPGSVAAPQGSVAPPGLVARPGSSVDNPTGDWRTERPRFLQAACTGCDLCVVYCPDGVVFKVDAKRYDCDLSYCKGCGICARECPVNDIAMEAELR